MEHEGTELVDVYGTSPRISPMLVLGSRDIDVANNGRADRLDYLFKFIVIGEAGTGKSCLLYHAIHDAFKENSAHTIGVEFSSRTIRIGERNIKLQLWDTAGQERFRSVTRSYYRGAAGALLVYDITSRQSFSNLNRWLVDCRALASPHLVTVLIGNKLDREEDREVEYAEGSRFAQENGLLFVEVSSLTGINIMAPFMLAAQSILAEIDKGSIDPDTAGTGISYGERQLRAVGSSSRLSTAFGSGRKRRRAGSVNLGDMVGQRRCNC